MDEVKIQGGAASRRTDATLGASGAGGAEARPTSTAFTGATVVRPAFGRGGPRPRRPVRARRVPGAAAVGPVGRGGRGGRREDACDLTGTPASSVPRRPSDPIGLLVDRFDAAKALTALELINSSDEFLDLAEAAQDAAARLGLGVGDTHDDLETLTLVGVRALMAVAATPAATPADVRRRARAYARQRCDQRVATMLAVSLEKDRRLHRMSLREVA